MGTIFTDLSKYKTWLIGTVLGLLTFLLIKTSAQFPAFFDQVYNPYVFPVWRAIQDYTFGLLPFSSLYILIPGLIWFLYRFILRPTQDGAKGFKPLQSLFRFISLLGYLLCAFYMFWGCNYFHTDIKEKKSLDKKLTIEDLSRASYREVCEINELSRMVDSNFLHLGNSMVKEIREDLRQCLRKERIGAYGHPTVRQLKPKGNILRISTAGFYLPFTGECNIDAGLHALEKPAVVAHELSHGFGITDEGSCNFWSYVACINSNSLFIEYSGRLMYMRELLPALRRADPKKYGDVYDLIDPIVIDHLKAIRDNHRKYPDILPQLRDRIYDGYLKMNHIEGGLLSYSRVVEMVENYYYLDSKD